MFHFLDINNIKHWGFPDSSCNAGDPGLIPGFGRSTGEGIGQPFQYCWASLVAQLVKNPPECGRPGFDSLEEGKATHSSILASIKHNHADLH